MTYSVYASANDAVNAIMKMPDFDGFARERPECACRMRRCEENWENITDSRSSFHGGGTKAVIRKFYGEHSYEASLTASLERQIESNEFYRIRFKFHSRQTVGSRVDIPRYLNGDQRHWFAVKRVRTPNKAIRVFAPMGGWYNVSSRDMQVCGSLTCALVEALETNGIGVELWASCCANNVLDVLPELTGKQRNEIVSDPTWDDICHLIKLKDSSQYCDYGMVNYITGDSGFYRNVIFKDRLVTGQSQVGRGLCWCGFGSSYNFERRFIPHDDDYDPKSDIVVPRIYNTEQAKAWLEENLSAFVAGNVEGAE